MAEVILPYDFVPRGYQVNAWRYFEGPEERKRGVCVWHRRAGKDLFALNMITCKAHERVGTYWHLLPTYKQGRAIVWNGFTRDGRKFRDYIPPDLIASENNTEMRITFKCGSIYQVVGTDNVDSLVGTNPIGCVFSEFSLQDPAAWDYIRPILAENGGWALFIYTARGRNHAYKMKEMAIKNPKWFCEILVAGDHGTRRDDGTAVISDAMIQDERDAGMSEEMVQQEFFCSFDAPLVGSYYGPQMLRASKEGRIGAFAWDPQLPVCTWWDLGISDSTSVVFTQHLGTETRVVDYYENSGEGLGHYVKLLAGQVDGYERMADYVYGTHTAPHDIKVREFTSGKARIDAARELGIRFQVAGKHDLADGIEAVRSLIPQCWFCEATTSRLVDALSSYRKEWDEERKVFNDRPVHDWSSHGADAFRTLAWGRKRVRLERGPPQDTAIDDHEYV